MKQTTQQKQTKISDKETTQQKQTKISDKETTTKTPILNRRIFNVKIAVFENEIKDSDRIFETLNVQKSYKDANGEWQNQSMSLTLDEAKNLLILLNNVVSERLISE